MGLLPEGEANLARLLGIVEKSQVMAVPMVILMLLVVLVVMVIHSKEVNLVDL